MTKNMGRLDRILRLLAAATLLYVAFGTAFAAVGLLHWLAIIVGGMFAVTALLGNCPAYSILGVKTCGAR